MRSPELEAAVRPSRFVMTVIWAAILASVGLYVLIAYVAAPGMASGSAVPETMTIGLTAAAVAAAAASLLLPSRLLSDARLRDHMQAEELDLEKHVRANPVTGPVAHGGIDQIAKLDPTEQRLATATSLYFTPWVVGIALGEAVAVFGLVLAFLTGAPDAMLPFAAVAAAILAFKRPRFEPLFLRLERLSR